MQTEGRLGVPAGHPPATGGRRQPAPDGMPVASGLPPAVNNRGAPARREGTSVFTVMARGAGCLLPCSRGPPPPQSFRGGGAHVAEGGDMQAASGGTPACCPPHSTTGVLPAVDPSRRGGNTGGVRLAWRLVFSSRRVSAGQCVACEQTAGVEPCGDTPPWSSSS